MFILFNFGSVESWYQGFFAAAMGVGVLVGEYYILSIGYRWIKARVEHAAVKRGIPCWVHLNRTSTIQFKHPQNVSAKQKLGLQLFLFFHVLALIFSALLWLGLVVFLGMMLFRFTS